MKKLLIGLLTFLGACKGSDFAIAEGLTEAEIQEITEACELNSEDFTFASGKLVMSRDVPFQKVACVMKRVQASGKYSGPDVDNAKYVMEPEE